MNPLPHYQDYSPSVVSNAFNRNQKVILFFYASWCPSCRSLHNQLLSATMPSDALIVRVNYDHSNELQQQYGVKTQHTLVRIDTGMNIIDFKQGLDLDGVVKMLQ